MNQSGKPAKGVLLMAAGIKGAIGSTLAAAVAMMRQTPEAVLPYLTTAGKFSYLGMEHNISIAGWDINPAPFSRVLDRCGVLDKRLWEPCIPELEKIDVSPGPDTDTGLDTKSRVERVSADIEEFRRLDPDLVPVFVNLLPAGKGHDLQHCSTLLDLYENAGRVPPDIVYAAAAIEAGAAVVNFTPNCIEIPAILDAAASRGIPVCGNDGKTGQTYFKVVLASAFKARNLRVNGWYSLNILGNQDGRNLMDPDHAACKLDNKTGVLEEVLGYLPGSRQYGESAHKVRIDYYPPRGDEKEAWDVIDFEGIFGMPMSMRVNLQGRDSILAAPMVIDLARWMAALRLAEKGGAVLELAFYFKNPAGQDAPKSFEEQVAALGKLEEKCDNAVGQENKDKE
ncbi:MAG: inositol-3-phosphate synthase [Desulfosalsimonas sp.]